LPNLGPGGPGLKGATSKPRRSPNYRLTTKLHKAKVCDDPKAPGAMRRKRVGNGSNIEKSHRVLVALGLAVCPLGDH
jgi:hypothetical protein